MGKFAEKDAPPTFLQRARPWVYGFVFTLIFALTATELGLDSHILHQHGNNLLNYPSLEFKNILGLMLFTIIATLLFIFSHPWSNVRMSCFWAFVFAIFWGTSAGVLNRVVPFEVSKCGDNPDTFAPEWRPWQNQCHELVALQGIAWALWGIFVFLWIGLLAEVIEIRFKHTVQPFYRAKFLDNV